MSDLERLIAEFDATETMQAIQKSMDAFAVAQAAFVPVAVEIERYNQMQIEALQRLALGVPEQFSGSSTDWRFLQSVLGASSMQRSIRAALRFACLPYGARAKHRKDLKRKRRKG